MIAITFYYNSGAKRWRGLLGREASRATRDNRFSDRLRRANQQAGNY